MLPVVLLWLMAVLEPFNVLTYMFLLDGEANDTFYHFGLFIDMGFYNLEVT